jgi:ABC-type uncharacterized transport system involved in gliding motility auxiliary subunit
MVFLGPVLDRDVRRYGRVGLEDVLAKWGVKLGDNIVVDPAAAHPLEGASVWATESYTEHAIVKKLTGKVTFWPQAREVRAAGRDGLDVQELVRTSDKGWGETNLAVFRQEEPLKFDAATDVKGPVPVAVAAEGRVSAGAKQSPPRLVVLGTPMLVENYRLKGDLLRDYNVDFALSATAWLANKTELVAIGPKQPEHFKLTLTADQLASAGWLTILGLPLFGFVLGGCVWWRRRS